ncbi:hypothetical protein Tco_0548955, partial [Tanacetum coccineum]
MGYGMVGVVMCGGCQAAEMVVEYLMGVTLSIAMKTAGSRCNMISFSDFLLGENLTFFKKTKKRIHGNSLNENFVVKVADLGSKKWKRKGAWRRGYFPKFNATV